MEGAAGSHKRRTELQQNNAVHQGRTEDARGSPSAGAPLELTHPKTSNSVERKSTQAHPKVYCAMTRPPVKTGRWGRGYEHGKHTYFLDQTATASTTERNRMRAQWTTIPYGARGASGTASDRRFLGPWRAAEVIGWATRFRDRHKRRAAMVQGVVWTVPWLPSPLTYPLAALA